ncbi:MAG: PAS domain S-box protein [Desulfobacter sp.]|nr:MAG: PAS domain S-box protein [Desulfobacter sp.]
MLIINIIDIKNKLDDRPRWWRKPEEKRDLRPDPISPIKLRKTLFLYSALLFLIFSFSLILAITVPVYNRLKEAENSKVVHEAETRAMAVNEWSRRVKDLAFQVTSRTRIRQELEKYNNGQMSLNRLQSFTEPKLSDAMTLSREIIGIIRLDKNGKAVARCGEIFSFQTSPIDYTTPFDISLSRPFRKDSHCRVIVSAPIFNRAKDYLGADLVLIDLCYLKEIVKNRAGLKTGHKILLGVVSKGAVSVLFDARADNREGRENEVIESLLTQAGRGGSGMDNHSLDHVAAYHDLDIDNWGLVVLQDKKELYKPLNTRFLYWGVTAVSVYMAILAGFWFLMSPLANRVLLHTDELKGKIKEKTKYLEKEIKEREQAENSLAATIAKLEDSNEKLRDLTLKLEAAHQLGKSGWWEYDVLNDSFTMAKETYAIYGLNPDRFSLNHETLRSWVHPDSQQHYNESIAALYQKGKTEFQYQVCLPSKEIKWIWAKGHTEYDANQTPVRLFGTFQDITAQKNAEEGLINSQRTLNSIIDFLPDPTFVINGKGEVTHWNKAIEKLTGIKADRILGKGNYEYAIPFYGERRPILVDFALSPNQELESRYAYERRADDRLMFSETCNPNLSENSRYLAGSASPLYDFKGNKIGAIETIRNITQKKIQEQRREKLVGELKQALEKVTTLSGLLPICASCKKIRDDKGYWSQIESYIQKYSEVEFSHGMCPECSDKLYGDQDWYIKMKQKKGIDH